jgi:hypothetical protein
MPQIMGCPGAAAKKAGAPRSILEHGRISPVLLWGTRDMAEIVIGQSLKIALEQTTDNLQALSNIVIHVCPLYSTLTLCVDILAFPVEGHS